MSGELPEKLYYSIGEVAEATGVKPHVLRYWEAEFPTLRPRKNRAGNRSYRRRDVDEILAIKRLLYQEGYKIDGARRLLSDRAARSEALEAARPARDERDEVLARLRAGLEELKEMLSRL
jgi:DNA-binding transcriptional MerR regulator